MYLFFDTETNGKYNFKSTPEDPRQPYIVQLAAMVTDAAGHVKAEMNVLIKPAGWEITPETEAVHHISQADCETFGIEIKDALYHFRKLCKLSTTIVAHNIGFDLGMIRRELHALKYGGDDFLGALTQECTMQLTTPVLKLIPEYLGKDPYKWPKLMEAYNFYFGHDFDGAHDAMADIRACRDVYFAYYDRIAQDKIAAETREALGAV